MKKIERINNVTELRLDLALVYEGLRNNTISAADAKEINNTAGKIINSTKVQLEYAAITKHATIIPFLD